MGGVVAGAGAAGVAHAGTSASCGAAIEASIEAAVQAIGHAADTASFGASPRTSVGAHGAEGCSQQEGADTVDDEWFPPAGQHGPEHHGPANVTSAASSTIERTFRRLIEDSLIPRGRFPSDAFASSPVGGGPPRTV